MILAQDEQGALKPISSWYAVGSADNLHRTIAEGLGFPYG